MSILRTYLMDDPLRYYMILIIRYYMILIMDVEYLCGIDLSRPQFKYRFPQTIDFPVNKHQHFEEIWMFRLF